MTATDLNPVEPGSAGHSPPRLSLVPLWIVGLALLCGLAHALLIRAPDPTAPPPAQTADPSLTPREACLRTAAHRPDYFSLSKDAFWRAEDAWAASCRQAMASDDDPRIKIALAQALRPEQRAEGVALLRAAAAQDDAEANYLIWDSHRSWDQQFDPPPLITRTESAQALRRAAELNYPQALSRLASLLVSGGVVKRDPVAARYWAERALANPPKDVSPRSLEHALARLLAESDRPEDRARGLQMLETLSRAGQFGAKSTLAEAIRRDDPVRARSLLEEVRGSEPGAAIPTLAEMLNNGEGGPADPKRAWKLLQGHNDLAAIEGMRGQFYLEGKQVPRDVAKAIDLIRHAGVWDYPPRLQVVQLLAANPTVTIERPELVLYHAVEAADLGETGAVAALIDLKLSPHPQFRDLPGGCKLLAAAAASDPDLAKRHSADCSAN